MRTPSFRHKDNWLKACLFYHSLNRDHLPGEFNRTAEWYQALALLRHNNQKRKIWERKGEEVGETEFEVLPQASSGQKSPGWYWSQTYRRFPTAVKRPEIEGNYSWEHSRWVICIHFNAKPNSLWVWLLNQHQLSREREEMQALPELCYVLQRRHLTKETYHQIFSNVRELVKKTNRNPVIKSALCLAFLLCSFMVEQNFFTSKTSDKYNVSFRN